MKREKYHRNRSINLMRNPLRALKVTSLIKVEVQVKVKVSAEKNSRINAIVVSAMGSSPGAQQTYVIRSDNVARSLVYLTAK